MKTSPLTPLGIDISKSTFDVALLKGTKRAKSAKFANTPTGFAELSQWLQQQSVERIHGCLEATGIYGHELARYLYQQGHAVSMVNPARIKGYAKSQLSRTKNDRADAALIARFCRDLKPRQWQPTPEAVAHLQTLSRRLGALEEIMTGEKNRLQLCTDCELKEDIEAHLAFLERQVATINRRLEAHLQAHELLTEQQRLLVSITGIGPTTALTILGEIGAIQHFGSARQLAAFAGLTPQEVQSGTSLRGKTRLCKLGNARLRKALYFPALVMIRRCPEIQAFRQRLLDAGKEKMQVVGAVMHKLIRVIYGVLKSGQEFDAAKLAPQST